MNKETFLEEIVARRRMRLAEERTACDPQTLRGHAELARKSKSPHRMRSALVTNGGVKIIGEFKRASPSLGVIRNDAQPAPMVTIYEAAGVCAVSILTEPDFFGGSLEDLRQARAITALPILRKDFIVDKYQIDEAAAAGADAVLLIVAALTDAELLSLRMLAEDELGLDALVEVHTEDEMLRAADSGARLIGVNNRDLRTFATSLETSIQLAPLAPTGATLVSESGLSSRDDIDRLARCGYIGFLIGEVLMRAADPAAKIRSLRGEIGETP
ncbi:MAG: indole-3-glycerol phosphate synthase TrpC [Verrucomicrobiota bacterium]